MIRTWKGRVTTVALFKPPGITFRRPQLRDADRVEPAIETSADVPLSTTRQTNLAFGPGVTGTADDHHL